MKKLFFIILIISLFGCSNEKIGTITEQVGVYNTNSQHIIDASRKDNFQLPSGARVKLVNKDGCPAKGGSEKMVLVMLRNATGDFVDGYNVCVPARKIKWD